MIASKANQGVTSLLDINRIIMCSLIGVLGPILLGPICCLRTKNDFCKIPSFKSPIEFRTEIPDKRLSLDQFEPVKLFGPFNWCLILNKMLSRYKIEVTVFLRYLESLWFWSFLDSHFSRDPFRKNGTPDSDYDFKISKNYRIGNFKAGVPLANCVGVQITFYAQF